MSKTRVFLPTNLLSTAPNPPIDECSHIHYQAKPYPLTTHPPNSSSRPIYSTHTPNPNTRSLTLKPYPHLYSTHAYTLSTLISRPHLCPIYIYTPSTLIPYIHLYPPHLYSIHTDISPHLYPLHTYTPPTLLSYLHLYPAHAIYPTHTSALRTRPPTPHSPRDGCRVQVWYMEP